MSEKKPRKRASSEDATDELLKKTDEFSKELEKELRMMPTLQEVKQIARREQRIKKNQLYDWNGGELPWWKKKRKYGGRKGRS